MLVAPPTAAGPDATESQTELCCSAWMFEACLERGEEWLGKLESGNKDSQAALTTDPCPQHGTSQIPTEGVCRDRGEECSNDLAEARNTAQGGLPFAEVCGFMGLTGTPRKMNHWLEGNS